MNKNNAKDYLPLVQALAEGKVIQYFPDESEGWIDCDEVNFLIYASKFRIKPEPLVIYAVMDSQDMMVRSASKNREWAGNGKVRKFVEVIED